MMSSQCTRGRHRAMVSGASSWSCRGNPTAGTGEVVMENGTPFSVRNVGSDRPRAPGGGADVARVAEPQDGHEDEVQQEQSDGEPGALGKRLGQVQGDDDAQNEEQDPAHERDDHAHEEEKQPPGGAPDDLQQDVEVPD